MGKNFKMKFEFPKTEDFITLFSSVGWSREVARVEENRKATTFAVSIYANGELVSMGRIVGDGSYFTIYDVVTKKNYQHQKLASKVMTELVNFYKSIKDDDTFLYVNATSGKEKFYERFGFRARPNEDVGAGMKWYE